MKHLFLVLCSAAALSVQAQKAAVKKPAPAKPATVANPLKNLNDSASYAIGVSVANFYREQGMKNLNPSLVTKAINDVYGKKKVLISEAQCNEVIMALMNSAQGEREKAQLEKAKPNIQKGEAFLAQNKTNPNVKTTASGLQYEVITAGTGEKPKATDTVTVNYKGTFLDGKEFDNSYTRGEPATFPLNQVIPGWTEGVQLMPKGSKYKFYIPYQLAYGPNDNRSIPGGSVLVFEVELLQINGK